MNNLSAFNSNTNRILKIFAAAAVILFVLSVNISAQLDPTFGTNGVTTTDTSGDDTPMASFPLPGGKILVFDFAWESGSKRYRFVRYNSDGTPDATYGAGGIFTLTIPFTNPLEGQITKAVRQSDGKIVLVGWDNFNKGIVLRYNEDGSLDSGFASGGVHRPDIALGWSDGINAAVIQPDGKIVVAGYTNGPFSNPRLFMLRYMPNGTLDDSFGDEGFTTYMSLIIPPNGNPQNLFLQSTGKILVVIHNDYTTASSGTVRRFNADGTIDNSFSIVSFSANNFRSSFMQSDDKILIGSVVTKNETLERVHTDSVISRYNADGSVDSGFGTGGQSSFDIAGYFDDLPNGLTVLPDGQIIVGVETFVQPNRGVFRSWTLSLARLSSSGALNGKFFLTEAIPASNILMSVLSDGKILATYRAPGSTVGNPDILLTRSVGVPLTTYRLHGVPFDFGLPAFNGIAEPAVFRPSDRRWYLYNIVPGFFFGLADDIPVPSDYIQTLAADMAVFRPSNGTWYIARDFQNASSNYITIQWGLNGDIPAPADYDGDGKSDLAVFRPSNGVWYIRNSSNESFTIFQWGLNGDKPVSGDYDGDGIYDVGVFRPSDGNWYILRSSDGQPYILHFGLNGDIPVHEDYDGDGKFDIAVYRPSDGIWYRLNSSNGSFFAMAWAIPADIPVPADYDGDLKADIAVWRQGNGRWYVNQSTDGAMAVYNWGIMGDIPLQRR